MADTICFDSMVAITASNAVAIDSTSRSPRRQNKLASGDELALMTICHMAVMASKPGESMGCIEVRA
jgi:hypothetical protein